MFLRLARCILYALDMWDIASNNWTYWMRSIEAWMFLSTNLGSIVFIFLIAFSSSVGTFVSGSNLPAETELKPYYS